MLAGPALMVLVAPAACGGRERRAMRLDPVAALRAVTPVAPGWVNIWHVERLRQRRTVAGPVRLVADERQLAVEAPIAQRFGRAQTRERSAHDHDAMQHGRSVFNRDCARGTLPYGLVHLGTQTLGGRLVQDVQRAVVTNLEYFRRRLHAQPVEIA
jgi:hypothetical protein